MEQIFDVKVDANKAALHLLPVPWDVTTSYGKGTCYGPEVILKASSQVDLYDYELGDIIDAGFYMNPIPKKLVDLNKQSQALAAKSDVAAVNKNCDAMTEWVYAESKKILDSNKLLGIIGGDHSVPLGAIKALSEKHKGDFSILHIDAHADLRIKYQGYNQSHASIMYNVMTADYAPKKLVQVGIRDFCKEELDIINSDKRIKTYFDQQLKQELFAGNTWAKQVDQIIENLTGKIYVSFDIDGLEPNFCPNTGTPVVGGISFDQAVFLFSKILKSGKKIIGFDLVEVSCGPMGAQAQTDWDANVGARALFKLCGYTVKSNL